MAKREKVIAMGHATQLFPAKPKFVATRVVASYTSPTPVFATVANPLPDARDLPPIEVSPVFVEAMKDRRCPHCDLGIIYNSPTGVQEETLHLNANLSAWLQTVGEVFARIYNDDRYRVNRGETLIELVRLFLLTPPAVEALKYDTRDGRLARGKTAKADWVDVQDATPTPTLATPTPTLATPPPAADPVEAVAIEPGDVIDVADADPAEHLYSEPPDADADDLYGDAEGETHPEHE